MYDSDNDETTNIYNLSILQTPAITLTMIDFTIK